MQNDFGTEKAVEGAAAGALGVVILPAGTMVKFRGMPFMLTEDAKTEGWIENYKLALSHAEIFG